MKSMLLDDQLNVDLRMRCQAQLPHRRTVLTRTSGLGPGRKQERANAFNRLAVTSRKRSPVAPELPTVAESGMPDYVVTGWYGLFVPAATPAPVVATLHAGAVKAIKSKEVSDRLSSEAAEIVGSSPQQFGEFLKAEIAKWAAVIKKAQIRPESL